MEGNLPDIWHTITSAIGMFPRVSLNAFNIWHLLISGNLMNVSNELLFLKISYKNWGLLLFFIFSFAALFPLILSKILDIGCSSGILLKNLKRKGFLSKNLFGVDISERAIHNSREKGLQNTFVMDAQKITLKEKFDIIISSDCLGHLKEDKKSNKELGQFAET